MFHIQPLEQVLKIQAKEPDIMAHDRERSKIIVIEVGLTSQDCLQSEETEKKGKYDLLAKKRGADEGYKVEQNLLEGDSDL